MTKKLISIIIALILVFQLGVIPIAPAQADLIKDCKKLEPKYPEEIKFETEDHLNFRLAFETVRNNYHTYVRCIFDRAFITILGSAGTDTEGIFSTSAPNFIDALPRFLQPSTACLDQDKLVKILKDSSPLNLLPHLLGEYSRYVKHLTRLFDDALPSLPSAISNIGEFAEAFEQNRIFKQLFDNEIQDAIVALDSAFINLKELRMALVMHVHFQCMLENLESYRRILGNLRSVLTVLPDLIHDASLTN